MATRKPKASGPWPKIEKGSHLTVITYENGKTELQWDDEALTRDVREALAKIETPTPKVKKTKKAPELINSVEISNQAIEKAKETSKKVVSKKKKTK